MRAVHGDSEAFRALVAPHLVTLRALCRRLAPSEADAQDLLQETLLAAFLGLGGLRESDRLGAWLRGIAARQALRMRRRAARRALPLAWAGEPASSQDLDLGVGLRAALAALPPAQRQVAVARWVAGYRPRELAAALGVPESTVRGRTFQARRRLRVALGAAPSTQKEPNMTCDDTVELVFEDLVLGRCMGESTPPVRRFASFRAAGEREEVGLIVPVADEDAAAIEGAGGELLGELLRFGDMKLEQATLEPLAAGAWSGGLHLRRGGDERRLATRPGEAIAAALALERPFASSARTGWPNASIHATVTRSASAIWPPAGNSRRAWPAGLSSRPRPPSRSTSSSTPPSAQRSTPRWSPPARAWARTPLCSCTRRLDS